MNRRSSESVRSQSLWSLLVAGFSILLSVFTFFIGGGHNLANKWAAIGISSVALVGVAAATYLIAGNTVTKRIRIALVGSPGVGKTLYVTALFDSLQAADDAPFSFAPAAETVNRVTETLNQYLGAEQWTARTPSDYLYLYTARVRLGARTTSWRALSPRRAASADELELEVADAAGEQIGEFVPGDDLYAQRTSYWRYAVAADAVFMFLPYSAVDPSNPDISALDREKEINELIFVAQSVAENHSSGSTESSAVPIAIVITKCDLAGSVQRVEDDQSAWRHEINAVVDSVHDSVYLKRLIAVVNNRFAHVRVFATTSTGPTRIAGHRIRPYNVAIPLYWALDITLTQGRRTPRNQAIG